MIMIIMIIMIIIIIIRDYSRDIMVLSMMTNISMAVQEVRRTRVVRT